MLDYLGLSWVYKHEISATETWGPPAILRKECSFRADSLECWSWIGANDGFQGKMSENRKRLKIYLPVTFRVRGSSSGSCSGDTSELFPVTSDSSCSTIYFLHFLLFVCMVGFLQSEVTKMFVHPTWFICNQNIIRHSFHKMKQNLFINLNVLLSCRYFFHTLHIGYFRGCSLSNLHNLQIHNF